MKQDYVNLHVHTVHSLLDGFTRVRDLCQVVKGLGQRSVAITDHGTMSGVPTLWREAREAGIKPIAGVEAYFCEDMDVKEKIEGRKVPYYHITLIAKSQAGYKNLCSISREAYTRGFYSKPRVDLRLLERYKDGLVCLSGCVGGWPQQHILAGRTEAAADAVAQLYSVFGEDFYLEGQDTGEKDQKIVNRTFLDWSTSYGIPFVLTGDSHYTKKEDHDLHDTLLCIGLKKAKSDANRIVFVPGRYSISGWDDLCKLGYPREALLATRAIEEKCLRYDLPRAGGLPACASGSLEGLAMAGLEERMPGALAEYWDRLFYELGVIYSCGYESYFLTIYSICKYANQRHMFHGWGRGSSAGSLVSYALGITSIDPLRYGLHFERFLNPDRREPPDVDLDFTDKDRPEIIKYIEDTFGKEHVSQVGTYGTLGPKQVLIDTAKALGKDERTVKYAITMLPRDPLLKISHILEDPKLMTALRKQLGDDVLECMEAFNEVPRHASAHAAGVIIDSNDLSDCLPMMSSKDPETGERTRLVTQYVYEDLEELGYAKVDVLGVKTLRVMATTARSLGIDLFSLPLDNPAAYDILSRGLTVGVFQFEHYGSQMFLRDFRPKDFNDVMMANALYRPGPMQGQQGLGEVISRRFRQKQITYAHKSLEGLLKPTYGLMLYQEQVMGVVQILAGWSLNEADQLRWAIGKKKKDKVIELREKFIRDCIKQGHQRKFAEDRFSEIEFFGRYGWNKAHAAAYGMVTYVSAYLKANHTADYMCELLNADPGDHERTIKLVQECSRLGLRVKKPHVNRSEIGYKVWTGGQTGDFLVAGLSSIKYLGMKAATLIVSDRKLNNIFSSVENFRERMPRRVVNSAQFEKLKVAGGFHEMDADEAHLTVPF